MRETEFNSFGPTPLETLQPVDLLVFGPHPDDLEFGCGGTVARHAALGWRVGLCDMSRGEMASNGTVPERAAEAEAARRILGAVWRANLALPDGAIGHDPAHVQPVVEIIRAARPRIVLAPYWVDRHPDHLATSRIVEEAVYRAGLRKEPAGGEPYRPDLILFYFLHETTEPDCVIDVTAVYEQKRSAIRAHASQVGQQPGSTPTRINQPGFLQSLESRDLFFGNRGGVQYAEGFVARRSLRINDFGTLLAPEDGR